METKLFKLTVVFSICISLNVDGKTSVSIQKAFEKKYITAKAICKGGLELDYSVSNLLKDSLSIFIPAGWRFNSDAGKNDYQDILLVHEEFLVLRPKETKKFDIKGYCCEASKGGPQKGAPYTLGKMADSSLVTLARYLNCRQVDSNTEQYSVWAISDGKETANITSSNDSIASLLRTFVAGVKGEPLPWYTLLKRARITQSGDVQDHPVRFKADINYGVTETCYSYCYIVDSTGQKVSQIFGKWLSPENTEYNTSFNVASLKKGVYKLILESKNVALFERAFKI
ncbi:MAG: hypothetical protein K0S53_3175 [Bacteroidetes bacterium]|jgi:hypothetical protein|nr:hypothetical protein [Bacteroidota bacterium]MDF2451955.1 hypothetical protein [Bacteroidota bacterium]